MRIPEVSVWSKEPLKIGSRHGGINLRLRDKGREVCGIHLQLETDCIVHPAAAA
jgi:hypothetical protein